jgi:uncharacterized protein (TIGR02996 family)
MSDEPSLLAAILAQPDEDTHRLVYADWLDENGQPERAEFIRVQCALARTPMFLRSECKVCGAVADDEGWVNHGKGCYSWEEDGGGSEPADRNPVWEKLRDHERELWNDSRLNGAPHPWVGTIGYRVRANWLSSHDEPVITIPRERGEMTTFRLHRGFVEAVTCTAADWLTHADTILARHPARKATLTTIPTGVQEGDHFTLDGDPKREHIPLSVVDAIHLPTDTLEHVCLRYRFPGVEFTLPPPPPVNRYIGTDADAGNPANWSLGRLPAVGDHVVIPDGAAVGSLVVP